ncbi:MAG TPA: SRPBCC domain-containing protein [Puia sp.]|nr:SRPBCC domain-containing protein [Puia sp.]
MKNEPFVIERVYNANPSSVWKAITDKDQMKQWYFDIAEFKPHVGFEFSFEASNEDRRYLHLCRVTEVIAGKKLAYSWRYEGHEGNSTVTFELFGEGNKTRLKLTHEGLGTFPVNNKDFARKNFEMGWTQLIGGTLKEFLEKSAVAY